MLMTKHILQMPALRKSFSLCFVFSCLAVQLIQAQVCLDVTVSLDANGYYKLQKSDIIHPNYLTEDHITFLPTEFTCEDIGVHTIDVLFYGSVNTYTACEATVVVRDVTPPVSTCFSNLHVVLNGQGQHTFQPQTINYQSTDECSKVGFRFVPSLVTCTDPNPMDVLVIARDEASNFDTCYMEVSWEMPAFPTTLSCRDTALFKLVGDEEILITADMIFEDVQYGCAADYTVELFDNGIPRPDPLITVADSTAVLTVTVTDSGNGNQCTSIVTVLTNLYCSKPSLICDTQCNSAPEGDCASGHTMLDNVEWPCDVIITEACPQDELYPYPDILTWYGLADSSNAYPQYGFDCLFEGYWDEPLFFPTQKVIRRHWTVLDWIAQDAYDYIQTITLEYDLTEICDTQPWNAPAGDCASGHTLTDDVEWPADITIHSPFAKPADLKKNSSVDAKNVEPQVSTGCNAAEHTYSDVVSAINDTTVLIERTWTVQDVPSLQTWHYVQLITIIREGNQSVVCVTREQGQGIPGVQLQAGIYTNVQGCSYINNPSGIIVTPLKDDPLKQGVNVHDQIAIREHLLGIRTLSPYQQYAADVNQDNAITEADISAIDAILNGTFVPPFQHTWKFFEVNTNAAFADISNTLEPYYFIGVKIGDVITAAGEEEIFLIGRDDVLNQGETYEIPFYLEREDRTSAIGIQFSSLGEEVEFLGITAPQLPDFHAGSFHILPGLLNVVWLAPGSHLTTGVEIQPDEPLFVVRLKANENIIMHDAVALGPLFPNEFVLPGTNLSYVIRLYWGDVIILPTVDVSDGRTLELFPNPVTDELHIKGLSDQDYGLMTVYDGIGRLVARSELQETFNISALHPGTYYISLLINGDYANALPFIKIE
jgi:hypothetical protein